MNILLNRALLTTTLLTTALLLTAPPALARGGKRGAATRDQTNTKDQTEKKEETKSEKKKGAEVTMGGVVFAHYGVELTDIDTDGDGNTDHFNAFDLDRAYVFAKADINDDFAARITLDADRQKASTIGIGTDPNGNPITTTVAADPKTRVFVKHAYLEWKTHAQGVKVRFGMSDNAWAPYYDGFMGLRYIGKSPADAAKFVSTADIGVQALGEHAKGLVSWQAGVINGEGFSSPEIDASKTFQGRVSIDPLAQGGEMNLPISGFFSQSVGDSGDSTTLYGGALGFKMPYLAAYAQYDGRMIGELSSSLISVMAVPKIPKTVYGIFRLDRLDPVADVEKDEVTTIIGGLGHDFYEKISLAATYERATSAAAPDLPIHGVFLRGQAGF